MKIVAISVVRNESDIIETFVRYHLQIVDHMIIINHRSIDSTGEILSSLRNEGLSIEVLENNSLRQPQKSELNMAMKKAVKNCNADWVLPLDADEFICGADKKIAEVIAEFPENIVVNIPWRTYVPLPTDRIDEPNILKRVQYCRKSETIQTYKVLVPKLLASKRTGALGFGSHHYKGRSFFVGKKFASRNTDKLFIAHFPVRDADQVKTKAMMGWLASLAKPDRGIVENNHLKRMYDRYIKEGVEISAQELSRIAFASHTSEDLSSPENDLICSPIASEHSEIELSYSAMNRRKPLELLAIMAEEYAEALSAVPKQL